MKQGEDRTDGDKGLWDSESDIPEASPLLHSEISNKSSLLVSLYEHIYRTTLWPTHYEHTTACGVKIVSTMKQFFQSKVLVYLSDVRSILDASEPLFGKALSCKCELSTYELVWYHLVALQKLR